MPDPEIVGGGTAFSGLLLLMWWDMRRRTNGNGPLMKGLSKRFDRLEARLDRLIDRGRQDGERRENGRKLE